MRKGDYDMKFKSALITGASRGIGAAIARQLAGEGYHLALNCSQTAEELQALKRELEADYSIQCLLCMGNVGVYSDCERIVSQAAQAFPSIDLLINNAGISYSGLLTDTTEQKWEQLMRTNLFSVFYMSKLVVPHMLSRHSGRMINISSVWGSYGASCEVAYSASKGGVNAFTKALARELGPSGIAVNAIACGIIDTAMNGRYKPQELEALCEDIPLGRMGRADEVAALVSQLAAAPRYLTGQILTLDGGWT